VADNLHRPVRRSIRLPNFDYSQIAQYFVTICAFEKRFLFGHVENHRVLLSWIGEIVSECWLDVANHFPGTDCDPFIVMPNHLHGILTIEARARRAVPLPDEPRLEAFSKPVAGSVPTMIRSYKSAVSKRVRDISHDRSIQVWQSNYFERVIRSGKEFGDTSRYILENPAMWHLDKENPQAP
jgi:putative transposase